MTSETCYQCGNPATSVEHVPARSFFPKDPTFRQQLITVPSCRVHNEDTSKDDEYIRNIIAMMYGTNAIAFQQFMDKVIKSLKKSPKLSKAIFKNSKKVIVNGSESIAFEVDRLRLETVMGKVGAGLYFREFKKPWAASKIIALSPNFRTSAMKYDDYEGVIKLAENSLPDQNYSGKNPAVFKYAFWHEPGDDIRVLFRLIFYECVTFYVLPFNEKGNTQAPPASAAV